MCHFQFHSINNVGLLEGQAGSAFHLQTINGVQYKSWFTGAGVGLDSYRYRTIPLFLDIRKEFGKTPNKILLFGDAGINFYWARDRDVKQFYSNDKIKNGFYGELGAGYKFRLNAKMSIIFSGSYSYKTLEETGGDYYYNMPFFLPGAAAYSPVAERIHYNLNRVLLKVGVEF